MCQTLFTIPHEWNGIPVFGFGWLLLLWSIFSVVVIASSFRNASTPRAVVEWGPLLLIVALIILFVLPFVEITAPESEGSIKTGLAIRGYGVMLGLAILLSIGLAIHRAKAREIPVDLVLNLGTWLVVSGIIGGRLFYLFQYWDEYRSANVWSTIGNALNFSQGGLVVYGAFIGGFVAYCFFIWRKQLSFLRWADMVVPSVMLGLALGRLGCFCNGCCYGGPTDHWWGVRFPVASVPYAEHRSLGRLHGFQIGISNDDDVVVTDVAASGPAATAGLQIGDKIRSIDGVSLDRAATSELETGVRQQHAAYHLARSLLSSASPGISVTTDSKQLRWRVDPWPQRTEPVQPAQLYSAVTAGLICLFLLAVEPFLSQTGSLFGLWITIYPPARFLLESIRVDEGSFAGSGLSIAQNISIVITVLAMGFWWYQWQGRKKGD